MSLLDVALAYKYTYNSVNIGLKQGYRLLKILNFQKRDFLRWTYVG